MTSEAPSPGWGPSCEENAGLLRREHADALPDGHALLRVLREGGDAHVRVGALAQRWRPRRSWRRNASRGRRRGPQAQGVVEGEGRGALGLIAGARSPRTRGPREDACAGRAGAVPPRPHGAAIRSRRPRRRLGFWRLRLRPPALREKGYRVAVLERGKRWAQRLPRHQLGHPQRPLDPRSKCFGILRLTFLSDVFVLSGSGVGGGGSLVYANTHSTSRPDAFFHAPQWAPLADWKGALLLHYRVAQFMLGVAQNRLEGEPDRVLRGHRQAGRGDSFVTTPVGVYFGAPGVTADDPYFNGARPHRLQPLRRLHGRLPLRRQEHPRPHYLYLPRSSARRPDAHRHRRPRAPGGGYAVTHERSGAYWLFKDRQVTTAERVVLSAGVLGNRAVAARITRSGFAPARLRGPRARGANQQRGHPRRHRAAPRKESWARGIASRRRCTPMTTPTSRWCATARGRRALPPRHHAHRRRRARPLVALGHPDRPPPGGLREEPLALRQARRGVFLLVMQTLDNSIALRLRRTWRTLWRRALDSGAGAPIIVYPARQRLRPRLRAEGGGRRTRRSRRCSSTRRRRRHILGGAAVGPSPRRRHRRAQ